MIPMAESVACTACRLAATPLDPRAGQPKPAGRRPGRQRDQRGSGSMLILCVVVVLALVGLVMAWQGSWLASGARARSVADLVAITAAQAQQQGRAACEVAEEVAARNAARLTECAVTTGWGEFVVDVTIEVRLVPVVGGGPEVTSAESRAGVVAEVS